MKINNECARKVLFEVEKIPYGEILTVAKLQEKISEFSIEDVLSIVTLFNKEYYLNVMDKASYDDNEVLRDNKIKCLTEKGYRALDSIRSDEVWNLIKSSLDNFNEISIFTIFDIARKITSVKQNELFDLPKDLLIQNVR